MILYPQIPHPVAEQLVAARRRLTVRESSTLAAPDHPDVIYTPTGGTRAELRDIKRLREQLVAVAIGLGFPRGDDELSRLEFDRQAAEAIYSSMQLEPSEASKPGVWEFLTCVALCDLVRWRFPGGSDGTPMERFLAGRRNALQRLWWRAFVFQEEHDAEPYRLLRALGEDEIVQIMERPFLAGSRALSRTIARELPKAASKHQGINRRTLIREAQKRLRRFAAFTSFEAIDEADLGPFVRGVFDSVAQALN